MIAAGEYVGLILSRTIFKPSSLASNATKKGGIE